MRYTLIIFDFDGTVCITHEAIAFCIQQTFKQLSPDIAPSHDTIASTVSQGISLEATFKLLNPLLNSPEQSELLAEYVITYRTIYAKEAHAKTRTFEGARQVFQSLAKENIKIVIYSNK